jgi:hypothetical protein
MNHHNPFRADYNRNATLKALDDNLTEAIDRFFEDEDEGRISGETVTIIVNGRTFVFPMEAELTNALFEFIEDATKDAEV